MRQREGVDKEFWKKAGNAGLLGLCIPEEFGGPAGDFTYSVILAEELGASVGSAYTGSSIMADVATYILMGFGTPEQKKKYAAGILSGEISQAMPLTEPDAGSDPTAIKATAVRDGKDWVINGEKYFISNGTSADVLYVVVKTDPT
jgi:alkylation response protein AidB-like acyl-CoA dehydrogenase